MHGGKVGGGGLTRPSGNDQNRPGQKGGHIQSAGFRVSDPPNVPVEVSFLPMR